jgi:hypothetical protein
VFVPAKLFVASLIFEVQAKSLPMKWSIVIYSTRVGSWPYWEILELADMLARSEHSSLLFWSVIYKEKSVYTIATSCPSGKRFSNFWPSSETW